MRICVASVACLLLDVVSASPQTYSVAARVDSVIRLTCPAITGVSIGDMNVRATLAVMPASEQPCAQPVINAFDPTDPALDQADLTAAVTRALDTERLISAVVWTVLKQMTPTDTDAQTRTKYGVVRTRIIDAFKSQVWK